MPKIKNRARLRKRMLALPNSIKKEMWPALEAGAIQVVKLQRSLVPVWRGDLRDSIDWRYGDPPKGARLSSGGGKRPPSLTVNDLKISIFAGSDKAYYARWVEFGTHARSPGKYKDEKGKSRNAGARGHAGTPARPFFFPAWRSLRKTVVGRVSKAVNKALKKAGTIQ